MTLFFFFQAEDGIRYKLVTGVQTCALPISCPAAAVDEGANHPQLLGEDEERRERGRAGEGAEQADGSARTRSRDGGVERVGLAADRLDDEVDRRLQRVAEETGCLAFAHHAIGPERQRRLALLRPAGDDEDPA